MSVPNPAAASQVVWTSHVPSCVAQDTEVSRDIPGEGPRANLAGCRVSLLGNLRGNERESTELVETQVLFSVMLSILGDANSPGDLCLAEVEWHRWSAAAQEAVGPKLYLIPLAITFLRDAANSRSDCTLYHSACLSILQDVHGVTEKSRKVCDFFGITSAFGVPCSLVSTLLLMQLWLLQLLLAKKAPRRSVLSRLKIMQTDAPCALGTPTRARPYGERVA